MSTTTTRKRKTVARKDVAKKRVVSKKTATRKPATRKPAAASGKKSASKRPAGSKSAAKKRSAAKKSTARRPAAKKKSAPSKKPSSKQSAARKKPARSSRQLGARNLTARTADQKAKRGQRRRSVVIVLAAITVVAGVAIGTIRSPLLDIERTEVVGASEVSVSEIELAARVPLGTSLIDLDPEIISQRVEAIPAVRRAIVTRRWNGVVAISVEEREPTLALKTAAGFVLVDQDGRQVRTEEIAPDGFVPIVGLQASGVPGDPAPPGSTAVLRLMEEMTPAVRSAIDEVIMTGDQMALGLVHGGRAVLGDERDLAAKVVSLETLLLSVDLRCVHEIDLTVPTAPAISRIGEKGNPRDGLADLTECS